MKQLFYFFIYSMHSSVILLILTVLWLIFWLWISIAQGLESMRYITPALLIWISIWYAKQYAAHISKSVSWVIRLLYLIFTAILTYWSVLLWLHIWRVVIASILLWLMVISFIKHAFLKDSKLWWIVLVGLLVSNVRLLLRIYDVNITLPSFFTHTTTWTILTNITLITWSTVNTGSVDLNVQTGTTQEAIIEPVIDTPLVFDDVVRDNTPVRYSNFLPLLLQTYSLTSAWNVQFANISSSDALYPAFVAAFNKKLIGGWVDPQELLKCKYIMSMIGLIEQPELQYQIPEGSTIHNVYRDYASSKWYLNAGCIDKDAFASTKWLP